MACILRLTNGIETIDLMSDNFRAILPWSPSVATKDGNGGYTNVPETITVSLKSSSILADVNRLSTLLNSTIDWQEGGPIPAVLLEYAVNDTATVWRSVIVAPSSGPLVSLPFDFPTADGRGYLTAVQLNFQRRGQWLSVDRSNLLLNGGFENWTATEPPTPDNWTLDLEMVADVSRNDSIVFEGQYSLDAIGFSKDSTIKQTVDVPEGVEVLVSAWFYINLRGASIVAEGETAVGATVIAVGEWVNVQLVVTGSSTGVELTITGGPEADSRFLVDAVTVVAIAQPTLPGDAAEQADVINGDIAALQFATPAPQLPEPVDVIMRGTRLGTNHGTAYAIVSQIRDNGSAAIKRFLATSFASPWGAAFTSVSDSAANPTQGTNVLRYTPAVTTEVVNNITAFERIAFTPSIAPQAVLLAKVRNNSSTASYVLRTRTNRINSIEFGKPIVVGPSASPAPQVVVLGVVEGPDGSEIDLGIRATATGAGTLDIDTLYLVYLTPHTYIIRIDQGAGARSTSPSAAYFLTYRHQLLSLPTPTVDASSPTHNGAWSATLPSIFLKSNVVNVCYLGTGSNTGANSWRMFSVALTAQTWTLSRLPGVLIPQ